MTELTKEEEEMVDRIESALIRQASEMYIHANSGRAYLGSVEHMRQTIEVHQPVLFVYGMNWNGWASLSAKRGAFNLEAALKNGLRILYTGCKVRKAETPRQGNEDPGNNLEITYDKDEAI